MTRAAQEVEAKLNHFSAIGANVNSDIPYFETKGLGEKAVLIENPKLTIVRPSLVFGPGDGFFSVCNCASRIVVGQPLIPAEICYDFIFHAILAGLRWRHKKFQPVYVGDLASLVEVTSCNEPAVRSILDGTTVEAGGPDGKEPIERN